MIISAGQRKVQTGTMKAYRKQCQYVYRRCQLGHLTLGNALIIAVCILMLPMVQLTTEHAQLVTTYHVTSINRHMNLSHAPLVLSSLNNLLSAMGIQNEIASSNSRCPSFYSRTCHVFPKPAVIVPFSFGKTVVDVIVALLLLSGDVEVNPGPVGKKLTLDDLGQVLEEVLDVSAQWYPLGLQLQVKTGTLDNIRAQFQAPRAQLLEMLKTWLNTSDNTSWKTLTNALRRQSVGAVQLAAALETKYCLGKETELHTGATPPEMPVATQPATETKLPQQKQAVLLDKQSVKQKVKELEKRFSDLVDCSYKALLQNKTEDNVRYFRSSFLSLDVSRKREHYTFIHEQLMKMDKEATFDEIWEKLTYYLNFLNFDLLEHIVNKFDIDHLKQKMETYERDLQSFRKGTRLCDFIYCWPVQGETPPEADLKEFVAKMKHEWDNCTLEDLDKLKGLITRKFFLPELEFDLVLKQIKDGCVVITWLMPTTFVKAVQEAIKTADSEFFIEQKIEAITIDGQDCYPSVTTKNTGYWKKPSVSNVPSMPAKALGLVKPDAFEEETMTRSDEKAWLPTPRRHTTPDSGFSSRCSNDPSSSSSSRRQVEPLASSEQYLSEADVEADPSLPTKYKDYLSSTPAIRAALYTTFNAQMAAEVFTWSEHTESPPPTTMTELFTAFTLKTLVDHLSTHPVYCKQQLKVTTFSDLPTDVCKQFQDLCRIAYEDILKRQQQVFTATHLPTGFASLGLMLYTEGRVSSYQFIHLTLREYLAAVHISQLPAHKQTRLFQEHLDSDHFKLTLRFLAGLTRLANITPDIIRRLMESDDTRLTYLHFLFEAGDISVTTRTLGSDEIVVKSRNSWTILDYYVTGYAISHSNYTWKVDFSRYSNEDEFEFFCQGCAAPGRTRCRGHILHADFKQNQITSKSINSFVNIPKCILQNMQGLHLSRNILNREACNLLAKIMPSMCGLEEIWLNDNPIESGGAVEVIKALCSSGVKVLLLYNTRIGEPDCEALCELLKSSYSLQHLDIDKNHLSSESVASIITGLSHNSSLTKLYASDSYFSTMNGDSLASILRDQSNCTLTKLVLRSCNIDGQGASKLAAALCENSTLKHMNLNDNPIGVEGASSMSGMLQYNTSLKKLYLSDDSVGKEGIHQLIEGLKHNQTLRKVQLSKKYNFMNDMDHKIEWL